MAGRMVLYRGCLKSCNYQCSYCPFSKHPMSERELAKDRTQWFSFVKCYEERAAAMGIRAMMIVPYGEALIHSWYWEGIARLSAMPETDAVGAQTNLSFSVVDSLENYVKMGGVLGKLRLWATFHPQMTTVSAFAEQCRKLTQAGVLLCAGSVGVPANLEVLQQLKAKLPENVYLWVNRMDGLKRPYTEEEKEAFLAIDPYFIRELTPLPADVNRCGGRLMIEGDGKIHTCNISPVLKGGWEKQFPTPECNRKICSCYLAYGGRRDEMNRILFGEYPLFRIPKRPQAVFLDIDGTLLPEEGGCVKPPQRQDRMPKSIHAWEERGIAAGLEALARGGTRLFFATTLPYEEAMKRCHSIRHLFRGGIFSGGAHIRLDAAGTYGGRTGVGQEMSDAVEGDREHFLWLEDGLFPYLTALQRKFCFRLLAYGKDERFYKFTLLRARRNTWERQEAEEIFHGMPVSADSVRYIIEGKCLQVVCRKADKAEGVRRLCQWLHISPEETAAVGNSQEDEGMMALCGMSK